MLPDPLPTCEPATPPRMAPARLFEFISSPLDREEPSRAPKAVAAWLPDPSPTLLPKTPPIIAPSNLFSEGPVLFFWAV